MKEMLILHLLKQASAIGAIKDKPGLAQDTPFLKLYLQV